MDINDNITNSHNNSNENVIIYASMCLCISDSFYQYTIMSKYIFLNIHFTQGSFSWEASKGDSFPWARRSPCHRLLRNWTRSCLKSCQSGAWGNSPAISLGNREGFCGDYIVCRFYWCQTCIFFFVYQRWSKDFNSKFCIS